MKQMTIKDVQNVSLDVLKEFDYFCRKNNLNYSLAYGTLIGAIRHRGFIPWDDDVDVMMPRPDYDRFVQLYKDNDSYKCFDPEKNNSIIPYARLADCKKTLVRTTAPWCFQDTGVWIDIFPIDAVEDDEELFLQTVKKYYPTWRKIIYSRQALGKLSLNKSLKWNMRRLFMKMLFRNSLPKYLKRQLNLFHRFDYDNALHVSNVAHMLSSAKSHFKKEMFEEYIDIPFEDAVFRSIKNYHENLTMIYGDYMALPPEEKRINHSFHDYYWL